MKKEGQRLRYFPHQGCWMHRGPQISFQIGGCVKWQKETY